MGWGSVCTQQQGRSSSSIQQGKAFCCVVLCLYQLLPSQHLSGWQQVVCPYQVVFSYSHESVPETQPPHTFPPPCGHVPRKPHPCPRSTEDPHTPGTAAPHSLEPHKTPGATAVLALQPSSRCEIIFQC